MQVVLAEDGTAEAGGYVLPRLHNSIYRNTSLGLREESMTMVWKVLYSAYGLFVAIHECLSNIGPIEQRRGARHEIY